MFMSPNSDFETGSVNITQRAISQATGPTNPTLRSCTTELVENKFIRSLGCLPGV